MIGRMTFFDRNENAAACRANFSATAQRAFNCRTIDPSRTGTKIDNVRGKRDWTVGRRWSEQFDRIFGGHRARRMIRAGVFHQMISRSPVAMTIEQRADDSAVQNAGKRFVLRLRLPFRDDFAVPGKTADAQTLGIRRTTTPA